MVKKQKQKKKKTKKNKKKVPVVLYAVAGLVVFWVVVGLFVFFHKEPESMYVFPENPKQGDTVFIKVKSSGSEITGNFGKEKINFFHLGSSSEWIAYFGIDAKMEPGKYKILINDSEENKIEKYIDVSAQEFKTMKMVITQKLAAQGYTENKIVDDIAKKSGPTLEKILSGFTPVPYFKNPFSFPLVKMEKTGISFGEIIKAKNYQLSHFGVDLRASMDTEIHAINDAKVVFAESLPNYGKTLVLDHGLGIYSLYLHLDSFKIALGQLAKQGQIIGLSGDSGYSTAPHLHFSIKDNGSRVDPIVFIETTKKFEKNYSLANIGQSLLEFFNIKK